MGESTTSSRSTFTIPAETQNYWLPVQKDRILGYEGNLTTEPSSENVTLLVYRDRNGVPISAQKTARTQAGKTDESSHQ